MKLFVEMGYQDASWITRKFLPSKYSGTKKALVHKYPTIKVSGLSTMLKYP
jgi:hypothetical protein